MADQPDKPAETAPAAAEHKPAHVKPEAKTVRLAVAFPVTAHVHTVEEKAGVAVPEFTISAEGTDVPADRAEEIIAAAAPGLIYEVKAV